MAEAHDAAEILHLVSQARQKSPDPRRRCVRAFRTLGRWRRSPKRWGFGEMLTSNLGAEREGFEPSNHLTAVTSLAGKRLQPDSATSPGIPNRIGQRWLMRRCLPGSAIGGFVELFDEGLGCDLAVGVFDNRGHLRTIRVNIETEPDPSARADVWRHVEPFGFGLD